MGSWAESRQVSAPRLKMLQIPTESCLLNRVFLSGSVSTSVYMCHYMSISIDVYIYICIYKYDYICVYMMSYYSYTVIHVSGS